MSEQEKHSVQVVIDDMTAHLESGCACCHTEGWRNSLAQLFPKEPTDGQAPDHTT